MADKSWTEHPVALTAWRLANFKSVEEAEVELAPLSVIVGANSAGKSSLLQSMLLLAQDSGFQTPGDLQLNGPLVGLGSFVDTVSDFSVRSSFKVGGRIRITGEFIDRQRFARAGIFGVDVWIGGERGQGDEAALDWTSDFVASASGDEAHLQHVDVISQRNDLVEKFRVWLRAADDPAPEMPPRLYGQFGSRYRMSYEAEDSSGKSAPVNRRQSGLRRPFPADEVGAVGFVSGIPVATLREIHELDWVMEEFEDSHDLDPEENLEGDQAFEQGGSDSHSDVIEYLMANFGDEARARVEGWRTGRAPRLRWKSTEGQWTRDPYALGVVAREDWQEITALLRQALAHRISDARMTLAPPRFRFNRRLPTAPLATFIESNFLYLGPLREDPRVTYPHGLSGLSQLPLGKKGESTTSLLLKSQSRNSLGRGNRGAVEFPLPSDPHAVGTSLRLAVQEWAEWFGLGGNLNVTTVSKGGVGYTLDGRDPTSIGTGVSQLLPVIVLCLMAAPGQVVLLEQPELHLNPGLQQSLADFFLRMVRAGRQLVVESHSEYLVTRLRRRAAEDPEDKVRQYFNIIFAERVDGRTRFQVMDCDDSGMLAVDEWPQGFFDQAGDDVAEIMRAARRRRSARAGEQSVG